jgi:hypothetical protein
MGRPPIGSVLFGVRMPPPLLTAINAWIDRQPEPKPTVPAALRVLAAMALACANKEFRP